MMENRPFCDTISNREGATADTVMAAEANPWGVESSSVTGPESR